MSRKSKRVGKKIFDYIILEKMVQNKRSVYKAQCTICGNIKNTFNLNEMSLTHSENSCKEMYVKSIIGKSKDDYTIIDAFLDRRLKVLIKCNICGEERLIDYRDFNSNRYLHSIQCILRSKRYNKKAINKICRTYSNCKTRIKKGNEGDPKYSIYKGKEFGFDSSLDLVYELYDNLIFMMQDNELENLTIDRIDNNLGYIPGNIRYVTMLTQNTNRSNSYVYYCDGEIFNSSVDLGIHLGISQQKVSRLFNKRDFFFYNTKFIRRYRRY